ncbi:hypothetical protein ACTJJ0_04750 [Chitinophaga sp. 22321]|uniref:Lipoprotein n=1 Tax=Chitinophaga hostae TaxID=2831022 RepID=A0ABS5IYA9_9BACT|nr:hypothetical protein [Chitinophaga hostae]MBS0027948.1 hypothetical protein [Chitinophaga hostae]
MKKNTVQFSICLLFTLLLNACDCGIWGAHDLGDKLTLLEGDKTEDRIIVYCTDKSGECCRGGISVVPSQERHYDTNGNYAEYVLTAKSNEKFVVTKTIQLKDKKENYWVISKGFNIMDLNCDKINCDSIIQSHIIGPLDSNAFENKMKELKIDLTLDK